MTHTAGWRARAKGQPGPAAGPARTRIKVNKASGRLVQDGKTTTGYEVAAALKSLVSNPKTPAAAKVNAARTLAEMEGLIGRHQLVPDRDAPSLATLSREALVEELERLRTAIDLGIVR